MQALGSRFQARTGVSSGAARSVQHAGPLPVIPHVGLEACTSSSLSSSNISGVHRPSIMGQRASTARCQAVANPIDYNKISLGAKMPANYGDDIPNWAARRRAGVIIHPTSLPGPYGIGEIGDQARKLIDWIDSAGLQVWQILPLVPPDPMFYSPYSGTDSNAGNPLVISIDDLIKDGLLDASDAPAPVKVADVDFPTASAALAGPCWRMLTCRHCLHASQRILRPHPQALLPGCCLHDRSMSAHHAHTQHTYPCMQKLMHARPVRPRTTGGRHQAAAAAEGRQPPADRRCLQGAPHGDGCLAPRSQLD